MTGRGRIPVPILFTIPNFTTAGSGQVMMNIVERLDRNRFAPTVCVLRRGGRLFEEAEERGLPLIEAPFTVPCKPYSTLPGRARRAAAPFRPHRFKLWHSFHYLDDYSEAVIARFAGASFVFTKKSMAWGTRAWLVRSYLARRIVADNSEMMSAMFSRPGLPHKVRVVPHGVDMETFHPVGSPPRPVRRSLGIADDAVVVGCVAHLVRVKGHPTLLEAVARVEGVHLLVAGRPLEREYSESLHRMTRELDLEDRVHFLGGVEDVPGLLREIDVAVLPTWNRWRVEGCPVALIEAMASGCACVATDIPGSRDLVETERSGLLVPPEDAEGLAGALRRLAEDPEARRRLGEAAHRRAVEHFSIEREAAAYGALYSEMLGLP